MRFHIIDTEIGSWRFWVKLGLNAILSGVAKLICRVKGHDMSELFPLGPPEPGAKLQVQYCTRCAKEFTLEDGVCLTGRDAQTAKERKLQAMNEAR